MNAPGMNLLFGTDSPNSAVQNIEWSKCYLEIICQVCVRYSCWENSTKKTDKGFLWVGFRDACHIARSGWLEPWVEEEPVECMLDRRTKQKRQARSLEMFLGSAVHLKRWDFIYTVSPRARQMSETSKLIINRFCFHVSKFSELHQLLGIK